MMRERRVELRCFARMPRERNSHHANGPMLATTGHRDAFRQVARRDCAAIARLKATSASSSPRHCAMDASFWTA